MDTQKRLHENISALADGELPHSERELAFAALDTADGQAAWRAYHLIGDALRDEADGILSDGFGAALAQRLDAEPAHELSPFTPGAGDPAAPPFDAPPPEDFPESRADVILP
ncbi:sigma-E factor negative regulatory protein RseA [Duganella sp. CF517]|uniref:sigma-E factor negative regulatory protein n=1 Tax=Duganella sp. CF517 TaxID=1881038 RepID=UPI0008C3D486|nr:sigma-E factor negative regulatory protein [Duganella sp. CF517]SEN21411.1 sigma-E factor negative regulatory protein RseA [Duganella sp. CF517]